MVAAQANAQTRAPGDWCRTSESRVGAANRFDRTRRRPAVAGFRARESVIRRDGRYTFSGRLPEWAARAFEPRNNR